MNDMTRGYPLRVSYSTYQRSERPHVAKLWIRQRSEIITVGEIKGKAGTALHTCLQEGISDAVSFEIQLAERPKSSEEIWAANPSLPRKQLISKEMEQDMRLNIAVFATRGWAGHVCETLAKHDIAFDVERWQSSFDTGDLWN